MGTPQYLPGSTLRAKIGPLVGETGCSATTLAEDRLTSPHGPGNRLSEQGGNRLSEQLRVKSVLAADLGGAFQEVPAMRGLDPTAITVDVDHLVRQDGHQAIRATDIPGRKPDNVPILRRPAVATHPFRVHDMKFHLVTPRKRPPLERRRAPKVIVCPFEHLRGDVHRQTRARTSASRVRTARRTAWASMTRASSFAALWGHARHHSTSTSLPL